MNQGRIIERAIAEGGRGHLDFLEELLDRQKHGISVGLGIHERIIIGKCLLRKSHNPIGRNLFFQIMIYSCPTLRTPGNI